MITIKITKNNYLHVLKQYYLFLLMLLFCYGTGFADCTYNAIHSFFTQPFIYSAAR
ncbi:hypothetical protein HMPREF0201_02539 [Cedecea davisae DSM 4568]|uniref:Uncharacterized protein n=1 Tax=Cedecea davisae DSM 4568 TaxID=566551 RepID=S3JSQ6_9ENTR|nr:hypothetical protein HMPREF0201_02539 [Cedecea davisae DSM 4568]